MDVSLRSLFLVLLLVEASKSICPENCKCRYFGMRNLTTVKCRGIGQVPCDKIPSTTVQLDLSGNRLVRFVNEECFRKLTSLKIIDLSRNSLRMITRNTFSNLTSLLMINLKDNSIKGGFYLPENVTYIDIRANKLSLSDLKVILAGKRKLTYLYIDDNPIGPKLTADVFAGFDKMSSLGMSGCNLEHIDNHSFAAMRNLSNLHLGNNFLTIVYPETLEGPGDQLEVLDLKRNRVMAITDGTFCRFTQLTTLRLNGNQLISVPDLTGVKIIGNLNLRENKIKNITWLAKSGIKEVYLLSLDWNEIEQLPMEIFQNLTVRFSITISFNKIRSIPDGAFSGCRDLAELLLHFNNMSVISPRTFSGLTNLRSLMISNNRLNSIPNFAFSETRLDILFLHNNNISSIESKAFDGLGALQSLTLFGNPITWLSPGIFDEFTSTAKVSITCKHLEAFPPGRYAATIECAPSASFYIIFNDAEYTIVKSLVSTGFRCVQCTPGAPRKGLECNNCSFCESGHHSIDDHTGCVPCPVGGFYQDEIGQVKCNLCSVGTYVPEERHPGKSATDCQACPYGTLSNETAGYRACRCLKNFYRTDRFGACTRCPETGFACDNDTAILAPNFYWKWTNESTKEHYRKFLDNILTVGPEYNGTFSKFEYSLPKPVECPRYRSCKGGIDSECHEGYRGTLCDNCTADYYLRFNTCIRCPTMSLTVLSSAVVVVLFLAVFLTVLWGDSKLAGNDRTVADVIMSCFKIVIGFHQVIAGVFSALVGVRWPITLIAMEKYFKLVEGNILQFAPLSCIDPRLRLDPLIEFALAIGINILAVCLILLYLHLKKCYINKNMENSVISKMQAISDLKKSCYRNIFLFLLLSYPMTSKKIVHILPLPGVCVDICFSEKDGDCVSLLKADTSIHCFTARHNMFWKIAAAFSLYPVVFPLLLLVLIYKYRDSEAEEEIGFGLRVFFENFKKRYWFWEIIEMYRKLILIALLLLFESKSHYRIIISVVTASIFGIAYTICRPIRGKFEDRLQTFALWVIFFDVCLGAIYSQPDTGESHGQNHSIFVNVLFVLLNSSVLIFTVGKGLLHLKLFWKSVCFCHLRCFQLVIQGFLAVKREAGRRRRDFAAASSPTSVNTEQLTQPLIGQEYGN